MLLDGDFSIGGEFPADLTFASGSLQQCVDISITDDLIWEDSETFSLKLSTADQAVSLDSSRSTLTAVIVDNELGRSSILRSMETVIEQQGDEVMVCVALSSPGPRERTITVTLQTEDDTATSGQLIHLML